MQLLPTIVQFLALALLLALAYKPLGDYMARLYTNTHDLGVEKMIYRGIGVDPRRGQTWVAYARSLLAFSFVSIILLYALQRFQSILPYSLGMPGVEPGVAFNTAISFVTNTNWQSYSPEQTLGYTVQAVGLTVQNFLSAAVGMSVAAALMRGLASRNAQEIGNFWVDLIRTTLRLLLPISVIGALILVSLGVIQNFHPFQAMQTLSGGTQNVPGGPVASQEVIKNLGTNGGGFFNANASHPFENPNPVSSLFQIFLMLLIPFALPRTFGKIVGDQRQGSAVLGVMALFYVLSLSLVTLLENAGLGSAPHMAGAAMEGKEQRFGIASSVLFGTSSTLTSTGAVNSMHDSYTAFGGLMPMLNMMLGEVAPGGVGSGLYGMLILAIVTVFVGGLLVGRTPEYLGKKIGRREIKLASLYILVMPTLVLAGVALSFAIPGVRQSVEEVSLANTGHHGLSEVIYAFTSAANNNGSAFAGLTASTPWFATALGFAMLLGRLVPIVLVLALAGAFAAQDRVPATSGTLPTHRPLFAGMLAGVTVLVTALTFFPMLTLGPISEGLIK